MPTLNKTFDAVGIVPISMFLLPQIGISPELHEASP